MADQQAGFDGNQDPTGAPDTGTPTAAGDRQRYLVAVRSQPGLPGAHLELDRLAETLAAEPGVRILETIGDPAAAAPAACPAALVVEAPSTVARRWAEAPQLIVEPDLPLAYTHPNPIASGFAGGDPAVLVSATDEDQVTIVVRGTDRVPLAGAQVYLIAGAWPMSGRTDETGRVALRLPAGTPVNGLWVRPRAAYWPVAVARPQPSPTGEYLVDATPLDATFDDFPKRKVVGWAYQALRLHEIAPTLRGHGVQLALIDSGVAATHPQLDGQIASGTDLVGSARGWDVDTLGHGTACAGIISASDDDSGIDGMAVDTELHVLKVMPGGRVSHLLKALDRCIRMQVDVVQISVGTLAASQLVTYKIEDARTAGILCVAPAGNSSAGPVMFAASLPTVLAVGAVGRLGTFPPDSHHPADLGLAGQDGMFVPAFTAAGAEVTLCAPGVAIVAPVPPDGYAMLDGCGVAAAHVTALAGLVLAHQQDFRTRYARGPARVDRLTQLITASCQPIMGLRTRTGAGVPDARSALSAIEPIPPDWASDTFGQLQADLARAGLIPAGPGLPGVWPMP